MSREPTKEQRNFAAKLVRMKAEAGRLELYRTMHALEIAVVEVGWDMVGEPTPKRRKP